jgi:hypothetical protein
LNEVNLSRKLPELHHSDLFPSHSEEILSLTTDRRNIIESSAVIQISNNCIGSHADPPCVSVELGEFTAVN